MMRARAVARGMPTLFDAHDRAVILSRIHRLAPETRRRWGRMSAGQMVAHLSDQMRHALGDARCRPVPGLLRNRLARWAAIYWLPWPRGRIKGPPDAFATLPAAWPSDLAALVDLVERFGEREPSGEWPPHGLFGPMTGRDWGHFCHKHLDHHLTQFGV
jgi:hypothetical protein